MLLCFMFLSYVIITNTMAYWYDGAALAATRSPVIALFWCLIKFTTTTTNNTILTGDFNAHHTLWHSPTTDNIGTLIADLINSSNKIVLNTNTPTRIPTNRNHQATSPDISTASNTIYNNITWSTLNALNSDHNPIKISYNTKTKFRLIQHRRSYTNYRKADWQGFTNSIENALTDTTDITDVHKSNKILTLLLLDADKHYIPKGKIRPNTPYFLKTSEHK